MPIKMDSLTVLLAQISSNISSNPNNLLITNDVWNTRIQDKGGSYDELGSKYYQRNKIISVGPEENKVFFYDLTGIMVKFCKIMRQAKDLGDGWKKLPKNKRR